ncbi:MAG TPA: transcriptional repressor LexA [Candidatus Paceibacterota bacterium]|nr:transcriptional repressor LexA [Candidatus Paceibacterota bacterium]
MQHALTIKQQHVLDTLEAYMLKHKEPPTLEELKASLKLKSLRTVTQYLEALEEKGYIYRRKHARRNIELRNADSDGMPNRTVSVPVVANVGCDDLSLFAQEQYDEFLEVDKTIADGPYRGEEVAPRGAGEEGGIVAVRAVGDSMQDAGINPGDYVLIRFTDEAQNGDRVAAIVGDMVTVKRYEKKNGVTILYPESKNPKYRPIVLREDFKIAGKVLCVIPNPHAEITEVVYE